MQLLTVIVISAMKEEYDKGICMRREMKEAKSRGLLETNGQANGFEK